MYTADPARYGTMRYERCGRSGLKLPKVSLGLWHNFGDSDDPETMKRMCFTAFDHGITHFDLANNYGPPGGAAERNFGKILREEMAAHRDEMIISTKAGHHMWEGPYGDWGSRKYLLASLDQSLKRLGLDYVDIFYHHRQDPDTPLEESLMALDTAVKSGRALYAGISRYDAETTAKAVAILKELKCPFIIHQCRYSLLDRSMEKNGVKARTRSEGLGMITFSPLAQGLLTDRYKDGIPADSRAGKDGRFLKAADITPEKLEKIAGLRRIAEERGQTLAEMALSWNLRDGDITSVLIGASRPEQILEDLKCLTAAPFTGEELAAIDALTL